jgi:hypothetical protein
VVQVLKFRHRAITVEEYAAATKDADAIASATAATPDSAALLAPGAPVAPNRALQEGARIIAFQPTVRRRSR